MVTVTFVPFTPVLGDRVTVEAFESAAGLTVRVVVSTSEPLVIVTICEPVLAASLTFISPVSVEASR